MKRLSIILISFIAFLVWQTTIFANELNTPPEGVRETTRSPLFTEEVTLEGESSEIEIVYELLETQQEQGQKLQLFFNHSSLLVAPSSLTVEVDGIPVKSIGLDQLQSQMAIPLEGNALAKGKHTVTIKYIGILKEGVCLNQNTSGNWLTLQISSFIDIRANVDSELQNLNQYPAYFIGTDTRNTQIIVSDEPTLKTLNAALELTNFLSNSSTPNKVKLLKESQVKAITDATIFIGLENEFKNRTFNELVAKSSGEYGLSLSIQTLELQQSPAKNVLVITGKGDEEFEKIEVLTEDAFVKQLQGSEITIANKPIIQQPAEENKLTFKKMGIPNLTLGYGNTISEMYFYYMPYYPFNDMSASIQLHLKISESILANKSDLNNGQELVVLINDVPHSIDLNELKSDENGDIFVEVPVSSAVFTQSTLMRIQLAANGLHESKECIQSDQAKWVYIAEASSLNFNVKNQEVSQYTFRFFPFPKIDELITIVVPDQFRWSDLLAVYESLTINNNLPEINLIQTDDAKPELLENSHVIFIGGKKQHELLKDEVLTVHYNNDVPDLTEHGFFNVSEFAFIQNNPWDEDFALVVFDALNSTDQYVPKEFAANLKLLGDNANIAVNGSGGKIHTNEAQVTEKNLTQKLTTSMLDSNSFYLFFLFLFAVIALIVFVWRKRKKK